MKVSPKFLERLVSFIFPRTTAPVPCAGLGQGCKRGKFVFFKSSIYFYRGKVAFIQNNGIYR